MILDQFKAQMIMDNGKPLIVPCNGGEVYYEFLNRVWIVNFRNEIVGNNPKLTIKRALSAIEFKI